MSLLKINERYVMHSPWKQDFPIFLPHAHPHLCYLDSAATCLTPKHVADAMFHHQCYMHANNPKGGFQLASYLTDVVEQARDKVATFLGVKNSEEIIFTRGTTDALNMVAYSYLEPKLAQARQSGELSNIVISAAEHEANILPWQRLANCYGAELRVIPLNEQGLIDVARYTSLLDKNTRLVAVSHCSNVLGLNNPVEQLCKIARNKNIVTVVDGAQAVSQNRVDVSRLGCDFYIFSAHKLYGPTACGAAFIRSNLLDMMRPYQLGGGSTNCVGVEQSDKVSVQQKLELNIHNIVGIIGLVEAIEYLEDISWQEVNQYLANVSAYLHDRLNLLPYYQPLVSSKHKPVNHTRIASFQLQGVNSMDVAVLLDYEGIALSVGTHSAQSLHQLFDVDASIRVSLGIYNDYQDVDHLIAALGSVHRMMTV